MDTRKTLSPLSPWVDSNHRMLMFCKPLGYMAVFFSYEILFSWLSYSLYRCNSDVQKKQAKQFLKVHFIVRQHLLTKHYYTIIRYYTMYRILGYSHTTKHIKKSGNIYKLSRLAIKAIPKHRHQKRIYFTILSMLMGWKSCIHLNTCNLHLYKCRGGAHSNNRNLKADKEKYDWERWRNVKIK